MILLCICKIKNLFVCFYTSDSVIHSTVIWLFTSVQNHIQGQASFEKAGGSVKLDFALYLCESHGKLVMFWHQQAHIFLWVKH